VKPKLRQPKLPAQRRPTDEKISLFDLPPEALRQAHINSLKRIYTEGTRRLLPEEKRLIGVAVVEADDNGDLVSGGYEGFASAIRNEFSIDCRKQHINDWIKGQRRPCPPAPPMPPPLSNGKHRKSLMFPWVRQYVLKQAGGVPEHGVDYRTRKEKSEAVISEIKADQLQKEISDKYILRDVAQASLNGALKVHHSAARRHFEKNFRTEVVAQLLPLGFSAEQLAQVADACEQAGRQTIKAMEEELEA